MGTDPTALRDAGTESQTVRGASDPVGRTAAAAGLRRRHPQAQRRPDWTATPCTSRTAPARCSTPSSTPPATTSPSRSSTPTSSVPRQRHPALQADVLPGIDNLVFIGFAQAIPTLFPFIECQAKLMAAYAVGRYAPPPVAEMERMIDADHKKYVGHCVDRPRHTQQVDYFHYEHDIRTREFPAGTSRSPNCSRRRDVRGKRCDAHRHRNLRFAGDVLQRLAFPGEGDRHRTPTRRGHGPRRRRHQGPGLEPFAAATESARPGRAGLRLVAGGELRALAECGRIEPRQTVSVAEPDPRLRVRDRRRRQTTVRVSIRTGSCCGAFLDVGGHVLRVAASGATVRRRHRDDTAHQRRRS